MSWRDKLKTILATRLIVEDNKLYRYDFDGNRYEVEFADDVPMEDRAALIREVEISQAEYERVTLNPTLH